MTLDEVRIEIDQVDSQIKPLFVRRMECAKHVAEAKAVTGADVFVPEREQVIIEKRTEHVDSSICAEYETFLRHLMSVSRRFQYGLLPRMQETVVGEALKRSGFDENMEHNRVQICFQCQKHPGNLNLFVNMIALNGIVIECMNVESRDEKQVVTVTLQGNVKENNMRRLLCQIGKEAEAFEIGGLI